MVAFCNIYFRFYKINAKLFPHHLSTEITYVTLSLKHFPILPYTDKKTRRSLIMPKRKALVDTKHCVACGCCMKVCPRGAITIPKGICAEINKEQCVGCGICAKECPASIITLEVADA